MQTDRGDWCRSITSFDEVLRVHEKWICEYDAKPATDVLVRVNSTRLVPKNCSMACAMVAVSSTCPGYSGWQGVETSGSHVGSGSVLGL